MNTTPTRALVISAHPDDMEFGAAGTLAKWTDKGIEVTLCIATDGSTGTQDRSLMGAGLAALRADEASDAAAILGFKEIVWLGHRDGYVEYSLDLRRDIARVFRRGRPHRFMVMDPAPTVEDRFVNHPDHRAVGQASLDTVLTAGTTPGHFPELLLDEGLEPWRGMRELWIMGPGFKPVVSDISSTIERKIQALLCHASQLGDESAREQVDGWLRELAGAQGAKAGFSYGESFQIITQGPGFHDDEPPADDYLDLARTPADPLA
ncbi:MAG: PIG-L family deacetylase [Actinobacteria bacterium]|nr:PIG-L family deacetylase [Actinomycetota bacterium]